MRIKHQMKKTLTLLLVLCLLISQFPSMSLAAGTTKSMFGLTVTQLEGENGGFSIPDGFWSNYAGLVTITKPGTYTISGTYDDGSLTSSTSAERDWCRSQSTWRGIIDVTQATGPVKLILDNVNITTTFKRNMPIILSRTSAPTTTTADVEIELRGHNTLIAGRMDLQPSTPVNGNGGGAIVKQGGTGKLTFTGSGSLDAEAVGVAIGSPLVWLSDSERQPYDCGNIFFEHTGTITATVSQDTGPCVGATSGYNLHASTNGVRATTSNIRVRSGLLRLVNTDDGVSFANGAMLGTSYSFDYSGFHRDIFIEGGQVTTSIAGTPGVNFYAIGGGGVPAGEKGVMITGGTLTTPGLTTKAQDARPGMMGGAYGAYISSNSPVSSLSVKSGGTDYPYNHEALLPQDGKIWFQLPAGTTAVSMNGTMYYGKVDTTGNTELKTAFTPVSDISGIPANIDANRTVTLQGVVSPGDATFNSVGNYELLDAGSTGATLMNNRLTVPGGGTVNLRATVWNGTGSSDFAREFSITSTLTPVTGISGVPISLQNNVGVTLTPAIEPANASYQQVVWAVKSGGATIDGNRVTPTMPGTLVLTASIANGVAYGEGYEQDFTIDVPFVPVAALESAIPASLLINESLTLSGSVAPENASYQAITWSVTNAGTTSATITDNKVKATATGTMTLRATIPNGAAAGQDFIKDYTVDVLAADNVLDISVGSITIAKTAGDATSNTVTYSGFGGTNTKDFPKDELLVLKGSYTGKFSWIIVDGATAKVQLQGIHVESDTNLQLSPLELKNNASLTMIVSGDNTFIANASAHEAAAIRVPAGCSLTIEDGGGSLTAQARKGAGIGGAGFGGTGASANGEDAGTIIINGGTVTASSWNGAGIGGGGAYAASAGSGGNITINGGVVNASSLDRGSGIGGGSSDQAGGSGGNIQISGGIVNASAGYLSAGIGGGGSNSGAYTGGAGGTVIISGGTVTATAKPNYSRTMAIGGGCNSNYAQPDNGSLKITGGNIFANRSLSGGKVYNGDNTLYVNCVAASSDGTTPVYKTTVDLTDTVGKNAALTGTNTIDGLSPAYGFNDVRTDGDGKVYLYLPESTTRTATFNGMPGYSGSTNTSDTGILTNSGLTANLTLGTPYLTDSGLTISATPSLNGTVHYLAVKDGASDAYASGEALRDATSVTVLNAAAFANTALNLSGMAAVEGDYTIYAALISTSGVYKSAVQTATFTLPATAPAEADVLIDYAAETLTAASGRPYTLQAFTTPEATTGGTAIPTAPNAGMSITAHIGSTLYLRKVLPDGSIGGEALALTFPAPPDAPASPVCVPDTNSEGTPIATTLIAAPANGESGLEYCLTETDGTTVAGSSWNSTGNFTALTPLKNYTVSARFAATVSAFASEPASTTASTVATVASPTKTGNGAVFAGNTVQVDRSFVRAGESITYTLTAISGYTPNLQINGGSAVALVNPGSGTYTYTFTPAEGTTSITAVANFDGSAVDHITADPVTMFADDARNASQASLEAHLATLTATARDSAGNALGTLPVTFARKEGTATWSATGSSYTYIATSTTAGKTCEMTVTVTPVDATITAIPPITRMVRPQDGYTTHEALGLPLTVTATCTAAGYTAQTLALPVSWSTIPANFGKMETGTGTPATFTGAVALPAWASGTGTVSAEVTITPKHTATITVTQADGMYGTTLASPVIIMTGYEGISLTDGNSRSIRYSGTITKDAVAYGPTTEKPTLPGTYTVTVSYEDETHKGTGSDEFVLARAPSQPNAQSDPANGTYIYGDTILLTAQPLMVTSSGAIAVTISSPSAINANLVDFHYRKSDGGRIQLNNAGITADADGVYRFSYNTSDKMLPIGETLTIEASYSGNELAAESVDTLTVSLHAKPLQGTLTSNLSKTYDFSAGFSDAAVTLDGLAGSDAVTAVADVTAPSRNVGMNMPVAGCEVTLNGADAGWYSAPQSLSGTLTITPRPLSVATATIHDKTYDGTTNASAVITFDGLAVGDALVAGQDYRVSAAFGHPDAGETITATVTLVMANTTATGNYAFSGATSFERTARISPMAISGTVAVVLAVDADGDGRADPGDKLTLSGVSIAQATVTHVWKRNGTTVGSEAMYMVDSVDVGKQLTAVVSGTGNHTGTLTSAPYLIPTPAPTPPSPPAPPPPPPAPAPTKT